MNRVIRSTAAGLSLFVTAAWSLAAGPSERVRESAVAGLFYPANPSVLARTIDRLLDAGSTPAPPGALKALICPHAGYAYSGPVAAAGFRLLRGSDFDTAIILAPSHYAWVEAGSVTDADVFRTPLGDATISPMARQLAQIRPFALEPDCRVQRPGWAAQSSRGVPSRETANSWEHADEVEVPFLQRTLPEAQLVPVVCGEIDAAAAARALDRVIDDRTVLIVSSDLSHYHADEQARELDHRCIEAILRIDPAAMARQEACGRTPILTLLHLAGSRSWKAQLLDYRHSGDTSGDKSRVVGYAAIAFYAPEGQEGTLSAAERRWLLDLARKSVDLAVAGKPPPEVAPADVGPALTRSQACFVTLTKRGALRGCIGNLMPQHALYRGVIQNAVSAALRDPRFPPVRPDEVAQLEIEISVLTVPEPLAFASPEDLLDQLQPQRDGVILQIGSRAATYLPQVWSQLPDKVRFLESLAEKAGCDPNDWRGRDVRVSTYRVEVFGESRGE